MKHFNIKDFLKNRPLSWSSMSSFEWDPEQWYESYILGKRQESKEMEFGSIIDKRIQSDPDFLPELPRYKWMQHKMNIMFNDVPLVGLTDGMDITKKLKKKLLADYKTGKKPWDQARADETGQLTFYLLLIYVLYKIKPEEFDLFIYWLPTKEDGDFTITFADDFKVHTFKTKRTMTDLLYFGKRINDTVKAMESYAQNHP